MRYFFLIFIFFFTLKNSNAEVISAKLGDTITLSHNYLNHKISNDLFVNINLGDYTSFYPLFITINDEKFALKQDDLENWSVDLLANNLIQSDSIKLSIIGIIAAGRTNQSLIIIDSISNGEINLEPVTFELNINREGFSNHYVRFPRLENTYPLPSKWFDNTYFAYTMDKDSDVKYSIYNANGMLLSEERVIGLEKGKHIYTFKPNLHIMCGEYILIIETNSGNITSRFILD